MRGVVGAGWSYLSLSRINAPRAASCAGPLPSQTRVALVKLMQQTNTPQPYPSYHSQQSHVPSSDRLLPEKLGNPTEHNIPLTTTSIAPATAENGHELAANIVVLSEQQMIATSPTASLTTTQLEKVPLVQRWRPSSGSGIGKSNSLDIPISIAHV